MPTVTYGRYETNIDKKSEFYMYITEINERISGGTLIVEVTSHTSGWFRKKEMESYGIYWELGHGEYQRIMAMERLDSQDVLCYLLGILTGLDKKKE